MPAVTICERFAYHHRPADRPLVCFPRVQHLELSSVQSFADLDKLLEGIPELQSFPLVRMVTKTGQLLGLTLQDVFVDALFSALSCARAPLVTALQHR